MASGHASNLEPAPAAGIAPASFRSTRDAATDTDDLNANIASIAATSSNTAAQGSLPTLATPTEATALQVKVPKLTAKDVETIQNCQGENDKVVAFHEEVEKFPTVVPPSGDNDASAPPTVLTLAMFLAEELPDQPPVVRAVNFTFWRAKYFGSGPHYIIGKRPLPKAGGKKKKYKKKDGDADTSGFIFYIDNLSVARNELEKRLANVRLIGSRLFVAGFDVTTTLGMVEEHLGWSPPPDATIVDVCTAWQYRHKQANAPSLRDALVSRGLASYGVSFGVDSNVSWAISRLFKNMYEETRGEVTILYVETKVERPGILLTMISLFHEMIGYFFGRTSN